jgi:phi13 family phage major tail protein
MPSKVNFGVSNVHYAVRSVSDATGISTYATPVRLPGATALSVDLSGDQTIVYADNIAYYTFPASLAYDGSVSVTDVPESFYEDVLGAEIDENGTVWESTADQISTVALMAQTETDNGPKYVTFYNITFGKPGTDWATVEDSPEAAENELSLTGSTAAFEANGKQYGRSSLADGAFHTDYFDAVPLPQD